ncbi:MAG TPA: CBS domain-containing protein [Blastocatellia bacterium]|nr:CBS domain-containing protein [Blastocatellia bacterium]
MSRSKEEREREQTKTAAEPGETQQTLNERLGARGQTDYTSGRESYRDFPRRSTSLRARDELDYQSRYSEPYRTERASRNLRRATEPDYRYSQRERADYDREGRYGAYEDERRYGRTPYSELTGRGRYRAAERDYDYDRERYRDYDYDRYADPYNRAAVSSRYDRYDRYEEDYEPTVAGSGWGAGRGIDTEQWRRERYERNILRCADIMTKDVTTCSPQTSIREVANMMEDENVGSIPVIEGGKLIGIVTDRDIVCRVVAEQRDTRAATVSEAMSEDVVTCQPDDTVLEAIRKMSEHQIRRLPITDFNGRLRGIISLGDIALEAERDRELARAIEEISRPTPNRSRRV